VPAFVKLLKDTEAEVRSAIAGQIPGKHMFLRLSWHVADGNDRLLLPT
jgi:hypothetical protein